MISGNSASIPTRSRGQGALTGRSSKNGKPLVSTKRRSSFEPSSAVPKSAVFMRSVPRKFGRWT